MNRFRNTLVYLLFFLIAFFIGLFIFNRWGMNLFVRHGQSKPIPDLTGMSLDEAQMEAEKMGFRLRLNNEEYSIDIPKDYVMNQIPVPGTLSKSGRSIKVTKSLGYEYVVMPDIIGKHLREASLSLMAKKLEIGSSTTAYSETYTKDHVTDSDPKPGEKVLAGTKIKIALSLGSKDSEVAVPDFVGMKVEDINTIKDELDVNVIYKYRKISKIPQNTVYEQSLEPGSIVDRGTVITLLVSDGVN